MGKKFVPPSIYKPGNRNVDDRVAHPHEFHEFTMEKFFERSETEVGTLDGVRIIAKDPKVTVYKEGELTLKLHSQLDMYLFLHLQTYLYVPEDIKWENGGEISKEKRLEIIQNLIQGFYFLGSWAVILPDGNDGFLEATLTERDKLYDLEKIHSIQVESYKKKEQELLYPVLDNSGVYASGINLQAYPTPGDPTPLLKSGLTPYELTTRYRFIQDQIEERKDFTYVERARIYIQDLGSYPLLCDGDFKFLPGPFGCGDFQFLFDLSGFLGKLNKFGRVKSVNGLAIEANRDVIDKLASMSVADEERSDASTLFLERFYPSVDNNGGIPHAI